VAGETANYNTYITHSSSWSLWR